MQSIGNVWVEKYVIAKEQNVARSIEMYLSRTPAAITPLGLVENPVLKAWSNGHMLTQPVLAFGLLMRFLVRCRGAPGGPGS